MEAHKLATEYREESGKGSARKLRAQGRIPAVIYGHDEDTVPITVDEKELRKILSGSWETAIVDLNIAGKVKKECNAIIKHLQQHPATGRVLHIDFQYVRRGEKIGLNVPVTLTGNPRGVKEMGGILEHGSRELSVRCMPRHIPEHIEIDVSELGIHDAVHIKDIATRYPDVEFLDDEETTLAIVVPPKLEVEVTPEEEEEAAEEPEVISKGKEEKGEEGEAEESG